MITYRSIPFGCDYVTLDSVPIEEECTQVGDAENEKWNIIECKAYIGQLIRLNPEMAAKCKIDIMKNYHEAGIYYDIAIIYHDDSEESEEAALWFEENAPDHWDEIALQELVEKHHPLHYRKIIPIKSA